MRLTGKRAVVTGASEGLGLVLAEALLAEGASVMICARRKTPLEAARALLERRHAASHVYAVRCDVACDTDVEAFAREAQSWMGGVDILVANAGIHGPLGALEDVDWKAWVEAIQVNLTGTVYCCRVFLPLLKKSPGGKILILSGGGATKPMPFFSAYAASKAAIVRFGETLAEELKPVGIDVNMIAPGAMNTRMLDQVLEAGPEKVGAERYRASLQQLESGGAPPALAAELCVYLAAASDGITGKLISAQWDPWRELARFKEPLRSSDIYTLRRILPDERGQNWNIS
jgi:3-oxoacyl-[acyl-carrier protein] reductase